SGRAAALRRAAQEAVRRRVARVVTLEGDGTHDPGDIPRLLKAATEAPACLVVGARPGALDDGAPSSAARRMAGFFLTWLAGASVTDPRSNFRVYPTALLAKHAGRRAGGELESALLLRAVEDGFGVVEVPIAPGRPPGPIARVPLAAFLGAHVAR